MTDGKKKKKIYIIWNRYQALLCITSNPLWKANQHDLTIFLWHFLHFHWHFQVFRYSLTKVTLLIHFRQNSISAERFVVPKPSICCVWFRLAFIALRFYLLDLRLHVSDWAEACFHCFRATAGFRMPVAEVDFVDVLRHAAAGVPDHTNRTWRRDKLLINFAATWKTRRIFIIPLLTQLSRRRNATRRAGGSLPNDRQRSNGIGRSTECSGCECQYVLTVERTMPNWGKTECTHCEWWVIFSPH